MAADLPGEVLPLGAKTNVGAHSLEFCPWRGTGTCRQHHPSAMAGRIDARRLPRSGLRAAAIARALDIPLGPREPPAPTSTSVMRAPNYPAKMGAA